MAASSRSVDHKKWDVLAGIDNSSMRDVVLIQVYGDKGCSAFLLTGDDQVYGVGQNDDYRLATGDNKSVAQPVKIDSLSGKGILGFSCGGEHVVAWSKQSVYTWGTNNTVGLGRDTEKSHEPGIVQELEGKTIVEVSSGVGHNLALTDDGQVYVWGGDFNGQCGTGKGMECIPEPEEISFSSSKVVDVACGEFHSLAVTMAGQVYAWGSNNNGQLGLGTDVEDMPLPSMVGGQLTGKRVVKVGCGYERSFALTSFGELYTWGYNIHNSLGVGEGLRDKVTSPVLVPGLPRVQDFTSVWKYGIAAAATKDSIYHWGSLGTSTIVVPEVSPFHNMFEVFFNLQMPSTLLNSKAKVKNKSCQKGFIDIPSLFNNKEDSDVTICAGDLKISAHKVILKQLCHHFRIMLDPPWFNEDTSELQISDYNPKVYFSFLEYLYTGEIPRLNLDQIIELWHIANAYFEEELKHLCGEEFKNVLIIENAADAYSLVKGQEAEELFISCKEFVMTNLGEVVLSEGFHNMDPKDAKELLVMAVKSAKLK